MQWPGAGGEEMQFDLFHGHGCHMHVGRERPSNLPVSASLPVCQSASLRACDSESSGGVQCSLRCTFYGLQSPDRYYYSYYWSRAVTAAVRSPQSTVHSPQSTVHTLSLSPSPDASAWPSESLAQLQLPVQCQPECSDHDTTCTT